MCSVVLHGFHPLAKEREALISEAHARFVFPLKWILGKDGYARHEGFRGIKLHQFVYRLQNPEVDTSGYVIDHINRDRLDNRIENLRLILPIENSWNRTLKPLSNIKEKKNGFHVDLVRNGKKLKTIVSTLEEAQAIREAHRF